MFKIANNRLIASGVSITMPTGMYLLNCKFESGVFFSDLTYSYLIKVVIQDTPLQTKKTISKQMINADRFLQKDVGEISFNGLKGVSYMYKDLEYEYYELKLKNPSEDNKSHICITLMARTSEVLLKDALLYPEIIDFFCNLRSE